MRDPFARLPVAVRLWTAALLCLAPMGLVWDVGAGFLSPGITMYGDCGYTEYTYCTPDTYLPGWARSRSASRCSSRWRTVRPGSR